VGEGFCLLSLSASCGGDLMRAESLNHSCILSDRPIGFRQDASCGLYLHIPFCVHKCAYCDFASYASDGALYAPYLAALRQEMRARSCAGEITARTLYVGGGTPTVLPAPDLGALVQDAWCVFSLPDDAEVTVESNPGTVDKAYLASMLQAGVNRLSLGVQSLNDRLLRLLGRVHTAQEAIEGVRDARAAGFENLNLDLMLGLPRQSLVDWQESVWRALDWAPEHLSLYALTVEDGTPLAERIQCGALPAPDDDLAADMYEWAEETLAKAGYVHYEISNWARPGFACRHNLIYWRNEPYLGLGAAAHSWASGRRRSNVRHPADYVEAIRDGRAPVAEVETIDPSLEKAETMMMGLRLLQEGVSFDRFERRFGVSMLGIYGAEIAGAVDDGLLECTADRVRLTRRGALLGNRVFLRFVGEERSAGRAIEK
jgi:oxygen-independent coproporphyrinogen-3 oxidase